MALAILAKEALNGDKNNGHDKRNSRKVQPQWCIAMQKISFARTAGDKHRCKAMYQHSDAGV